MVGIAKKQGIIQEVKKKVLSHWELLFCGEEVPISEAVSTMWGSHCLLSYRKKCVYVGGSGEEGNSSGFAGLRTITYISSNKNTTFYLFTGNAAKSQQKLLQ